MQIMNLLFNCFIVLLSYCFKNLKNWKEFGRMLGLEFILRFAVFPCEEGEVDDIRCAHSARHHFRLVFVFSCVILSTLVIVSCVDVHR